jgi:hypothetical protein
MRLEMARKLDGIPVVQLKEESLQSADGGDGDGAGDGRWG